MPYSKHKAGAHIQGISAGDTWQGAIKRNGEKPTIYPHTKSADGHVKGHSSKSDPLGKWHHCDRR